MNAENAAHVTQMLLSSL